MALLTELLTENGHATGGRPHLAADPKPGADPPPVAAVRRPGCAGPVRAVVAVAAFLATAVVSLAPGPPVLAPAAGAGADVAAAPGTGPSAGGEPSPLAGRRTGADPRIRPAAVADCGGTARDRPAVIFLACGDGGAGLKELRWRNWGEPVATATGRGWQQICRPNCAEGGQDRFSVTVTVGGLKGGRYTSLRITAPHSPMGPVADYWLKEDGPWAKD